MGQKLSKAEFASRLMKGEFQEYLEEDDTFYDYDSARKAGAKPDASGHWPSEFKKPGHPNEVVGGFNTRTGERVPGTKRAKRPELIEKGWSPASAAKLSVLPDKTSDLPPTSHIGPTDPLTEQVKTTIYGKPEEGPKIGPRNSPISLETEQSLQEQPLAQLLSKVRDFLGGDTPKQMEMKSAEVPTKPKGTILGDLSSKLAENSTKALRARLSKGMPAYRGVKEGRPPQDPGDFGVGEYFSTSSSRAKNYGRLTQQKLQLQNPLVLSSKEAYEKLTHTFETVTGPNRKAAAEALTEELRKLGHDGLAIINEMSGEIEFVRFPAVQPKGSAIAAVDEAGRQLLGKGGFVGPKSKGATAKVPDMPVKQSEIEEFLGRRPNQTRKGDIEEILKLTTNPEIGGATWHTRRGNLYGTPHYAVATRPEANVKVSGRDLTSKDIADFIQKTTRLRAEDPTLSIGTWWDKDKGRYDLDLVSAVADREEAIQLGLKHGQDAIYDLKTGETIYLKK